MEKTLKILNLLVEKKAERRRKLAALPFEEKFMILLELQKMTVPLLQAQGKKVKPWEL